MSKCLTFASLLLCVVRFAEAGDRPAERQFMIQFEIFEGDPLGDVEEGTLRMLSRPRLAVLNGSVASFVLGGERSLPPAVPVAAATRPEIVVLGRGIRIRPTGVEDRKLVHVDAAVEDTDCSETTNGRINLRTESFRTIGTYPLGQTFKLRLGKTEMGDPMWAEVRVEEIVSRHVAGPAPMPVPYPVPEEAPAPAPIPYPAARAFVPAPEPAPLPRTVGELRIAAEAPMLVETPSSRLFKAADAVRQVPSGPELKLVEHALERADGERIGVDFDFNAKNAPEADAPLPGEPLIVATYALADLPCWKRVGKKTVFEPALLIALVKSVDPESWNQGASLNSYPKTSTLVIRQTPANHDAIAALLSELRATAAARSERR